MNLKTPDGKHVYVNPMAVQTIIEGPNETIIVQIHGIGHVFNCKLEWILEYMDNFFRSFQVPTYGSYLHGGTMVRCSGGNDR